MSGSPRLQSVVDPFDEVTDSLLDSAYVNVMDHPFSAIRDGVTDDSAALQAAIDYASANSLRVRMPAGIYAVYSEVQVDGAPIIIEGEPHNFSLSTGTQIKCFAAARSGLAVLSPRHQISNLIVNANGLASNGVYFANASVSRLTNVWTTAALLDGFANAASGNNNHIVLDGCYATNNGKTYVTAGLLTAFSNDRQVLTAGTVATTASNSDIVFTGAPDMTTLGLRKGDLIAIGGTTKLTASYFLIESALNATTVRLQVNATNRPATTASGLDFAIGVGDGVSDRRNGNGGVWDIRNLISFSNGGSGIHLDAAYGHIVEAGDVSYNNFAGVCFGIADNAGVITNATVKNLYCEGTAIVYFLGAGKITIENPSGELDGSATAHFIYATDAITEALVTSGNVVYDWRYGQEQNFVIQITNTAGTLQHRIMADLDTGGSTNLDNRITGATNAYTNIPSVSSVVAFSAGGGILSTATDVILLETARSQSTETPFRAIMEGTNTGTQYTVSPGTVSSNVNGVTRVWPSFRLRDLSGAAVAWATALAAPSAYIAVRVSGKFR